MRDGTYPPRSFATLGPSKYSRHWTYLRIDRLRTAYYNFKSLGRRQTSYFVINISWSLVFLVNSRTPQLCTSWRSYIKFHKNAFYQRHSAILPSSLNTFALFISIECYQFTCVGLRYGISVTFISWYTPAATFRSLKTTVGSSYLFYLDYLFWNYYWTLTIIEIPVYSKDSRISHVTD